MTEDSEDELTTEERERIRTWDPLDTHGLLAHVADLWRYPNYVTREGETWSVSTGGWSGNEEIIDLMMENQAWWVFAWAESRRGGHYVFRPISKAESPAFVDLLMLDSSEVYAIIEHPSGVVYGNQVGGTACRQTRWEGVLVPLGCTIPEPDPVYDFASRTSPVAVKCWLEAMELAGLFEPVSTDEAVAMGYINEAWLPVRVRASVATDPIMPHLAPFAGRRAVLTYTNSD